MLKFLSLSAAALLVIAGPVLAAPDDTTATPEKPVRGSARAPFRAVSCVTTPTRMASSTAPNGRPRQEARFKQLDTNGDGKLTQDELFARTPAIGNSVLPTDRQAQRQSTYFQLLDADKDGVVTLAEFMAQADRNFARCDINKDGRIDTAECRQALQRRSTQR